MLTLSLIHIYTTEIKTGSPASLTLGKDGKVRRINLSDRQVDQTALPMNVTAYDLEDKLTITGLVLGETKTYEVDHCLLYTSAKVW